MKLTDLVTKRPITIQCHDHPDADALASGYALYTYLKSIGCNVRLIYSGIYEIKKSNLVSMIELLQIPIEYVHTNYIKGLLITVDCQYGAGNVSPIPADDIAIIDHHEPEITHIKKCEINSDLGSCSTLIWNMLKQTKFNVNSYPLVSTALYYGLLTDTSYLAELYHPLDKDMRDSILYDESVIKRLKNSNLSLDEIKIVGDAFNNYIYNPSHSFALIKSKPCDPNILGMINDMVLQVDKINICIAYTELDDGIKISVRSCVKEVLASELATYLTFSLGSGGGHMEKAGGVIKSNLLHKTFGHISAEEYLLDKTNEYFDSFDIIDATKDIISYDNMSIYDETPSPNGYINSSDLLANYTPAIIRTIVGDVHITVNDNLYIMVDAKGTVHTFNQDVFLENHTLIDKPFIVEDSQYFPSIKSKLNDKVFSLEGLIKTCIPKYNDSIYIKKLTKVTKLFTDWNKDVYMYGNIGDYLAIKENNPKDMYIIPKESFDKLYFYNKKGT